MSPAGKILLTRQVGRGSLEMESVVEMTTYGVERAKKMHEAMVGKEGERVGFL